MQSLHALRNLYFISSRMGQNSSSQHMFITLTSVDILAQYPDLAENLLRSIKPNELGQIPGHPLERSLDLFFLNTAELFTIVLSPKVSEELLISAAVPYLAAGANKNLLEIFEAAHSVVLAVFAIPKNGAIAAKHLPFYIDNLFAVCQHKSDSLLPAFDHLLTPNRYSLRISRHANSALLSKQSFKSLLLPPWLPTTNPFYPPYYLKSFTTAHSAPPPISSHSPRRALTRAKHNRRHSPNKPR